MSTLELYLEDGYRVRMWSKMKKKSILRGHIHKGRKYRGINYKSCSSSKWYVMNTIEHILVVG